MHNVLRRGARRARPWTPPRRGRWGPREMKQLVPDEAAATLSPSRSRAPPAEPSRPSAGHGASPVGTQAASPAAFWVEWSRGESVTGSPSGAPLRPPHPPSPPRGPRSSESLALKSPSARPHAGVHTCGPTGWRGRGRLRRCGVLRDPAESRRVTLHVRMRRDPSAPPLPPRCDARCRPAAASRLSHARERF